MFLQIYLEVHQNANNNISIKHQFSVFNKLHSYVSYYVFSKDVFICVYTEFSLSTFKSYESETGGNTLSHYTSLSHVNSSFGSLTLPSYCSYNTLCLCWQLIHNSSSYFRRIKQCWITQPTSFLLKYAQIKLRIASQRY